MNNLDLLEPAAKESVVTHMKAFSKMAQDGGSPLPIEMSLAEKNKELEISHVKAIFFHSTIFWLSGVCLHKLYGDLGVFCRFFKIS